MEDKKLTVQSHISQPVDGGMDSNILWFLSRSGELLPPWWSRRRDFELRRFWKNSDHLSGAIYSFVTKITTIPFKVIPRDMSVKRHQELALEYQNILENLIGFGDGWDSTAGKAVQDLVTTDNGMFFEVIGDGKPDGPIVGPAVGLAHLDSLRCRRTGNVEFPVVYQDDAGKLFRLHRSRVIFSSQMTSPTTEMKGVGFCAVSRAVNVAQNLIDIAIYKQEKLGSRPQRQVIIGRGISADDILAAFRLSDEQQNNEGLSRFAKTVVVGSRVNPDIGIDQVDLSSVPDGFDEETSVTLGMYVIALALGVEARDLWPATASGATKADALVQAMKARGKGPGSVLSILQRGIEKWFLPPVLRMEFDFQDDEEDAAQAEQRNVRSETHERNVSSGIITTRVARQQMLEDGDLTEEQFVELELADERTETGESVLSLFDSNDRTTIELLNIGAVDPLDVAANDKETMLAEIEAAKRRASIFLMNIQTARAKAKARQALAALAALEQLYKGSGVDTEEAEETDEPEEMDEFEEVDEKGRMTQATALAIQRHERGEITKKDLEDYLEQEWLDSLGGL